MDEHLTKMEKVRRALCLLDDVDFLVCQLSPTQTTLDNLIIDMQHELEGMLSKMEERKLRQWQS